MERFLRNDDAVGELYKNVKAMQHEGRYFNIDAPKREEERWQPLMTYAQKVDPPGQFCLQCVRTCGRKHGASV